MPKKGKHILVMDSGVPTHDQDSGSLRMYSMIKILAGLYRVTFIPGDGIVRDPYAGDLKKLGVEIPAADAGRHLEEMGARYSLAIISRPEVAFRFLPRIRACAINSKVVYDTVDVHWLRHQRAAELYQSRELAEKARSYRRIENINALCSDLTLTVTENDKVCLLEDNPRLNIEVIPNIHDPVRQVKTFRARKNLMFIGGFYHHPNVDAVLFFAREILPLIRKRIPGIKLYVVGSNPPASILKLHGNDITVTGYVKDVRPYFDNCRVFISPLRYGAGMKGKIGQSMSFGLPVVTTSIGAEGMGLAGGETALVADSPENFAQSVIRLYSDESLWTKLALNSVRHIWNNYSPAVVGEKLKKTLTALEAARITLPHFYSLSPKQETESGTAEAAAKAQVLNGGEATGKTPPRGSVLVAGVYLADKKNTAEHLVKQFKRSKQWQVTQKWAAIGKTAPSGRVAGVTVLQVKEGLLKYEMINRLLAGEQLDGYDFVIISDDDITLPPDFLDNFLDLQLRHNFALAQPARTHQSYIDHVFVERLDGITARRTLFNEIGPLNSFRRDAFRLLFPFDVSITPMGWGYDFVWPLLMEQNSLKVGIIDATPVDHSLRKPVSYYRHEEARRQMEDYLSRTPHYSREEAFTILESFA